jgi:phosphatidylglycerophosphatase A
MRNLILFLATGGFSGYAPVAPGTVGSLVAIPLFWLAANAQQASFPATLVVFAVATLLACWVATRAEVILQEHDSHAIVIDEILGYFAATLFLPPTWSVSLIAFFVFRAFDIVKPFPAGWIDESMPRGYGVVLDDVVSGFYANLVTRAVLWALS